MAYSLYFHIPFCSHRCAYCDFNTYARHEHLIPAYVEALVREVGLVGRASPQRVAVHSIFFGGGTPSLLSPAQFETILHSVRQNFDLVSVSSNPPSTPFPPTNRSSPSYSSNSLGAFGSSGTSGTSDTSEPSSPELSLEANPGTVSLAALQLLRQAGFNRISFGVQSFHPTELRQLERIHDPFDVYNAVRWARRAGFDNLNLDLIYGLPEQTLARWQANLERAVELSPQHLSLYALTIEPGTPYGRWSAHGLLPQPDPDLAADMYEWAAEFLAGQGYEQYEISNWSKPGYQCRHNLQYWRNQPYLGFGAGAHGCAGGMRISNVLKIQSYLDRFIPLPSLPLPLSDVLFPFPISPATRDQQPLTTFIEMQETMMLGLRLTREGVSAQAFQDRFGQDVVAVFGRELDDLVRLGLLEHVSSPAGSAAGRLFRLTRRGRLLGNQVFMRFVGE